MENGLPEFPGLNALLAKEIRVDMSIPCKSPKIDNAFEAADQLKKRITEALGIDLFSASLCYRAIEEKEKLKIVLFSPNFAREEAERVASAIREKLHIGVECKSYT